MRITEGTELTELICAVYWCSKLKRPHWFKFFALNPFIKCARNWHDVQGQKKWYHEKTERKGSRLFWQEHTRCCEREHCPSVGLGQGPQLSDGAWAQCWLLRREWVSEEELLLGRGSGGELRRVSRTAGAGTRRAQEALKGSPAPMRAIVPWHASPRRHQHSWEEVAVPLGQFTPMQGHIGLFRGFNKESVKIHVSRYNLRKTTGPKGTPL